MKTSGKMESKSALHRARAPAWLRGGLIAAAVMGAMTGLSPNANAAGQVTTTMAVSMTIQTGCSVATTPLSYGTAAVLTSAIDQTASLFVTCTDNATYQVGLDNGTHASGSQRRMYAGATDYIAYDLYSDAGRATAWGNTQSTDTVLGTGNGNVQTITVYGRVPAQASEDAGGYSDVVTVYVYF